MQTINSNQLSIITGGCVSNAWTSNNINSFVSTDVLARSAASFQQAVKSNMGNAESAPHYCGCDCPRIFASPKNGDRNAKGQIFSWGTWWDDMN